MPDLCFTDDRLAAIYDVQHGDRQDLDAYVELARDRGVRSALDLGCGTGVLACRLASEGVAVVAVDPAAASLAEARKKPEAGLVEWVFGEVQSLRPMKVDLVMMTGNVAQVFTSDEGWRAVLSAIRDRLADDGVFVFEVRDPARRAWLEWTPEMTRCKVQCEDGAVVECWTELLSADGEVVSFTNNYRFGSDDVVTSESTLRFRPRSVIEADLVAAGFTVAEVRDAPDRPGLEIVFLAECRSAAA